MYRTVFGLTFILLLICQSVEAQSSISRLIGTKKEYYLSTIGWKATDSSRYVYSSFGTYHQTPDLYMMHPGLVGSLPLYTGADDPFYYTGMFYTGAATLLYNPDPWRADSIISYWFDVWPITDQWSMYQILHRTFYQNMVDSSYFSFLPGSFTTLGIQYDASGRPLQQETVGSIYSNKITFTYSSAGLTGYIKWSDTYGEMRKNEGKDYVLNAAGKPIEELHRLYDASLASNPSHVSSRLTYTYNASGLVTNRTIYTSGAEGYISTASFEYIYTDNTLHQYVLLEREVDTTFTPAIVGDWDTTLVVDLYFTGTRIDSVIRHKKEPFDATLELDLHEEFIYAGDQIDTYTATYYNHDVIQEIHHIHHNYDTDGRMIARNRLIEYSTYCTELDTTYTYNSSGYVISKEVFRKTSYDQPCNITETEPYWRYYYYYDEVPIAGEGNNALSIEAYPNPTNAQITIQIVNNSASTSAQVLSITDMLGRSIYATMLTSDDRYVEIPCSTYGSGLYIVKLEQDGLLALQKIIVR